MSIFGIDVCTGLMAIAVVYIGFSLVYLMNMIAGVIVSCLIKKEEKFSLEKFLMSFVRILFCALAMFALVVAVNLVSQGLFEIEPEIAKMVTSIISIGAFALILAKGFLQKAQDLIEKVKFMLEINSTNDIDDEAVQKFSEQSLADLVYDPTLEPEEGDIVG